MEKEIETENELIVENNIRGIIRDKIISTKKYFTLLDSKNVADIIICRNIIVPKIFFIEVKHFSSKKGRIGFGNDKGDGFQPEILRKRPKYLDDNLIWIFQKEKDKGYYVLNNDDCMKYISGGIIGDVGGKQNNFQSKLFEHIKPFNDDELINWLENWLLR